MILIVFLIFGIYQIRGCISGNENAKKQRESKVEESVSEAEQETVEEYLISDFLLFIRCRNSLRAVRSRQ